MCLNRFLRELFKSVLIFYLLAQSSSLFSSFILRKRVCLISRSTMENFLRKCDVYCFFAIDMFFSIFITRKL